MLKALAIKELRESAIILGVAALAMLWLLGNMMNWRLTPLAIFGNVSKTIPFVGTGFSVLLIFFGGTLAVALGLKQSAWENSGKKYYFLLHRPVEPRTVFLTKIGFGLACLLALTVGPTLVYANWAATPGKHSTPFFWGMTSASWMSCLTLPSVYLGALLSGLRPAHWLGTRLLPGVGTVVLATLAWICWWGIHWLLGLVCLAALDLVLLQLILATAEQRDY